ncbi:GNAT family acetyltransferase [Lysinibacillus contaminans]|uniref:GNAT family acetyltransferase n=1 Tax=Lysinibacillus contaminans TaxID=1293441 RepID=A0ABR5JXE2_9BACI|nr:GNAT family N-acetyltransferase [Lysinibacillus contaminans]KOS66908.1 GNAT family acetyltransferase [Lysinibacillus contaminans]
MNIVLAKFEDATVIHQVMLEAFKEYEHATPPSSALSETVFSIEQALNGGEQAFIAYVDERPVAMVRFTLNDKGIYFFRLSVIPERQGQGLAKALVTEIEKYACTQGKLISECKVRMDVLKNIALYKSMGYVITKEEVVENRDGVEIPVVTMAKILTAKGI